MKRATPEWQLEPDPEWLLDDIEAIFVRELGDLSETGLDVGPQHGDS